jgi:hypothetical protein
VGDIYKAQDRLVKAKTASLGQRVPEPLHHRLVRLCDIVYDAGERVRPTKADMVAALILAAPEEPEELVRLLRAYGSATVGDTVVGEPQDVISLESRTPGPRTGRAS